MKLFYKTSNQIGVVLFLIIVSSFYWWQNNFSTKKITIDLNKSNLKPALNIQGAKYSGFSKNGETFSVSAKLITENLDKNNVLNLTKPSATIETNKSLFFITSNNGEFNLNEKEIILIDNVSLINKVMEYKLFSEHLNANLDSGEFYTDTPVKLTMPSGLIVSEKLFFDENEKKFLFQGNSKLVLLK